MLRKLWHRRALCSVRCFKNGFHQTEQNLGHFISGLRVKMCVWLGVLLGLDLAFLDAD